MPCKTQNDLAIRINDNAIYHGAVIGTDIARHCGHDEEFFRAMTFLLLREMAEQQVRINENLERLNDNLERLHG